MPAEDVVFTEQELMEDVYALVVRSLKKYARSNIALTDKTP